MAKTRITTKILAVIIPVVFVNMPFDRTFAGDEIGACVKACAGEMDCLFFMEPRCTAPGELDRDYSQAIRDSVAAHPDMSTACKNYLFNFLSYIKYMCVTSTIMGKRNIGLGYESQGKYADELKWLLMAANAGDAEAESRVSGLYFKGHGVSQDYDAAALWAKKAADQGYPDAMYSLGYLYQTGHGVAKDVTLSHMWYNLAAARGDERAASRCAELEPQMTQAQITEARRLARKWKPAR